MDFPVVEHIKQIIEDIRTLKRDVATLKALFEAFRVVLNERKAADEEMP